MEGFLYFDNSETRSLLQKIQRGAEAYEMKFGVRPTRVMIQPEMAPSVVYMPRRDLRIERSNTMLPDRFWFGVGGASVSIASLLDDLFTMVQAWAVHQWRRMQAEQVFSAPSVPVVQPNVISEAIERDLWRVFTAPLALPAPPQRLCLPDPLWDNDGNTPMGERWWGMEAHCQRHPRVLRIRKLIKRVEADAKPSDMVLQLGPGEYVAPKPPPVRLRMLEGATPAEPRIARGTYTYGKLPAIRAAIKAFKAEHEIEPTHITLPLIEPNFMSKSYVLNLDVTHSSGVANGTIQLTGRLKPAPEPEPTPVLPQSLIAHPRELEESFIEAEIKRIAAEKRAPTRTRTNPRPSHIPPIGHDKHPLSPSAVLERAAMMRSNVTAKMDLTEAVQYAVEHPGNEDAQHLPHDFVLIDEAHQIKLAHQKIKREIIVGARLGVADPQGNEHPMRFVARPGEIREMAEAVLGKEQIAS